MLLDNYNEITPYLPKNPLNKSQAHTTPKTFFPALQEIEELKNVYNNDDPANPIKTICSFLEIIRKFHSENNQQRSQDILGNYIYILKQQGEALSFCSELSSKHHDPFKILIETAKKILIEEKLLDKAILDIKLQPYENSHYITVNQTKLDYYENAIEWLKKFSDKQSKLASVINEIEANAHYYLGKIYESNGCLAGNSGKSHWLLAIKEYVAALNLDKKYNFIYENQETTFSSVCDKIGNLLLELGESYKGEYKLYLKIPEGQDDFDQAADNYNQAKINFNNAISLIKEAIKYFKISVNGVYLKKCNNILTKILDKQPKNIKDEPHKELLESLGDFFLKVGLSTKAAGKFSNAQGIAQPSQKQDLNAKFIKAQQTEQKTRVVFSETTFENNKTEDLSIFATDKISKEALLLTTTIELIREIFNPGKIPGKYDILRPTPVEVPKAVLTNIPPYPAAVPMPQPPTANDVNTIQLDNNEINGNVELVQLQGLPPT